MGIILLRYFNCRTGASIDKRLSVMTLAQAAGRTADIADEHDARCCNRKQISLHVHGCVSRSHNVIAADPKTAERFSLAIHF